MQICGRLPIANHLDQSLWLPDQKPESSSQQSVAAGVSQIISVWTLSLAGVSLCCAVSSLSKLCKKMLGQNHFAESTGMF